MDEYDTFERNQLSLSRGSEQRCMFLFCSLKMMNIEEEILKETQKIIAYKMQLLSLLPAGSLEPS